MITVIVRFPMKPGTGLADAKALFESTAPRYRGIPGLLRKYYLFGEDGMAGGVYLWESRAQAETMYNDEWRGIIAEKYGSEPEINYYESPVIVENQYSTSDAAE